MKALIRSKVKIGSVYDDVFLFTRRLIVLSAVVFLACILRNYVVVDHNMDCIKYGICWRFS